VSPPGIHVVRMPEATAYQGNQQVLGRIAQIDCPQVERTDGHALLEDVAPDALQVWGRKDREAQLVEHFELTVARLVLLSQAAEVVFAGGNRRDHVVERATGRCNFFGPFDWSVDSALSGRDRSGDRGESLQRPRGAAHHDADVPDEKQQY